MASKKRTLLEAILSDEPSLWLQLADGERLPAHRELLALVSRCARGLPPGAQNVTQIIHLSAIVCVAKGEERFGRRWKPAAMAARLMGRLHARRRIR